MKPWQQRQFISWVHFPAQNRPLSYEGRERSPRVGVKEGRSSSGFIRAARQGWYDGSWFVHEHRGSFRASSGCDHITGKSGWSSFATRSLRSLCDNQGPGTHPTGVGSWYVIARLRLGSPFKQSIRQQVIRVNHLPGGAEPHSLYFPGFNLIEIAPYAHKHVRTHTYQMDLVMQLSNSACSGVLYWNSDHFRDSFWKLSGQGYKHQHASTSLVNI